MTILSQPCNLGTQLYLIENVFNRINKLFEHSIINAIFNEYNLKFIYNYEDILLNNSEDNSKNKLLEDKINILENKINIFEDKINILEDNSKNILLTNFIIFIFNFIIF
jgi:hypothetical protein